jgi:hypothetical protein
MIIEHPLCIEQEVEASQHSASHAPFVALHGLALFRVV